MMAFISTMEDRIQEPIPFGTFRLYPQWSTGIISPLCHSFGTYILNCILIFDETTPEMFSPDTILDAMPQLKHLRIKFKNDFFLDSISPPTKKLTSLRSFVVSSKWFSVVDLRSMTDWIEKAPALVELKCQFVTHCTIHLLEFIKSIQHLRTIGLKVRLPPSNPTIILPQLPNNQNANMNLDLEIVGTVETDGRVLTQWVSLFSGFLRSLTIGDRWSNIPMLQQQFQLPFLPNLKNLDIRFGVEDFYQTQTLFVSPFDPVKLPALKNLSLHFTEALEAERQHPFRQGVFESVDILLWNHPYSGSKSCVHWHEIFPNLKKLNLGWATAGHLRYIGEFLPNLEHLYLSDINCYWTQTPSGCSAYEDGGIQWPLISLTRKDYFTFFNNLVYFFICHTQD